MTPEQHAKAIEEAAEQYAYAYSIDDFKDRSKAFDVLQDAIWAGVGAAPEAAPDLVAELEEVKTVCAQAYQVVGILLADAGRFDSPEAEKILDNLGEQRLKHTDVLPWESKAAPEGWQLVPVEPTVAQREAMRKGTGMSFSESKIAYSALLAAAPKP